MAILPGSLDYLYYNGILDHIPYEAYEQLPVNNNQVANPYANLGMHANTGNMVQGYGAQGTYGGVNGSQYMDMAMSGNAYGAYNSSADSFVRSYNGNNAIGQEMSVLRPSYDMNNVVLMNNKAYRDKYDSDHKEKESFRESIMNGYEKAKEKVSNTPTLIKGLVGAAIMVGTLCLLLKGKKP